MAIPVHQALKLVGILACTWAILVVLSATLAYVAHHPGFSPLTTYLSDIGDTPGAPQILFNAGTLIAAPVRLLVLVLVVLRLAQLGAGRLFGVASVTVGFVSVVGTVLMTAAPFSVAPAVHKMGIPLYFFGVVVLQTLIGVREWTLAKVPNVLSVSSFLVMLVFLVFATLVMLAQQGVVERNTPVIWEWLAFLSSVFWLLVHSVILGRPDPAGSR
jgi:hypothetical membrane protein